MPKLVAGFVRAGPEAVRWHGTALGADARLTIHHPDSARARYLAAACLDEVERLERIFSLYRGGSELSGLNKIGRVDAPSPDLVALLHECRSYYDLTRGVFDPTVQPLWHLHAAAAAQRRRASPMELRNTLGRVGFDAVDIGRKAIRLGRAGMALTLNGIAQGFVTDCIADLLHDAGMTSVLVEMGEIRALGAAGGGAPWRIGLRHSAGGRPRATIELAGGAVASSGAYGTRLDPVLGTHHLFDPRTGGTPEPVTGVTVIARRAAAADALSTVLCIAPALATPALLRRAGAAAALRFDRDGRVIRIEAGRTSAQQRG